MIVLGLDVSTKVGWAVAAAVGRQPVIDASGVLVAPKPMTGLYRASLLAEWVSELLKEHEPDYVMIEGYGYANKFTLATLVEVGTVIRYFLLQEEQGYTEIPPAKLKKFVTGKGNVKKQVILLHLYKVWGLEYTNDDEADAVGLAIMGLAAFDEIDVTKARSEVAREILK